MPVSLDPMQDPFEFPADLSKLTKEEREELHLRYQKYCSTTDEWDTVESSPSEVIDVNSPAYQAKLQAIAAEKAAVRAAQEAEIEEELESAKASGMEFVEGVGYVCPAEEDLNAIAGRLSPEAWDALRKRQERATPRPRPAPKEPPMGDTEDRFDNLIL